VGQMWFKGGGRRICEQLKYVDEICVTGQQLEQTTQLELALYFWSLILMNSLKSTLNLPKQSTSSTCVRKSYHGKFHESKRL